MGHPLLIGEELYLLSQDDVYLHWHPGGTAEYITIAHPVPNTPEPDLTPVTMFGGYPLAKTSNGILIADDHMSPFIAVFSSMIQPVWHRDIMNTLGVPAVNDATVFTNVGGESALSSLIAVDSRTGLTQWQYAPKGIPEETVEVVERSSTRQMSAVEKAIEKANSQALADSLAKAGRGKLAANLPTDSTVTETAGTPMISTEHGHWTNPGLSLVGKLVYGEVGKTIVALDQTLGTKVWTYDLGPAEETHSIVASKEHLFVSLNDRLIALNLVTGALEWDHPMMRAGTLSMSNGLLIFTTGEGDGGEVIVFTTDKENHATGSAPPP